MNEKDSNELKRGAGYLKEKAIIGLTRVTGDELDRAILKVTSHMLKAPKEKHMQRLLAATHGHYKNESRDGKSICEYIISELEKRLHTHNWIVVLKCLVTLHRLMTDGSIEVNNYIQRNRNIFCARNLKDLSESVEGSAQAAFIRQYMRYLEERSSSQEIIGINNRMESVEFTSILRSLDVDSLIPLFQALLSQLTTLVEVEYRETIVDNFCTLEAYQRIVDDGKSLYQLLSNRIIFILDGFSDFSIRLKKIWLELYRQYNVTAEGLRFLFNSILSSSKVFAQPPPHLKPLPVSLLEHLEEDVRMSNIPIENVTETLESLGIMKDEKEDPLKEKNDDSLYKQPAFSMTSENTEKTSVKEPPSLPPTYHEKKEAVISMDDLFIGVSSNTESKPVPSAPNDFLMKNSNQPLFTPQYDVNTGGQTFGGNNNALNTEFDGEWSTGAPTSWETPPSVQYPMPNKSSVIPHDNTTGPFPLAHESNTKSKKEDTFKQLYTEGQKGWYSKDA